MCANTDTIEVVILFGPILIVVIGTLLLFVNDIRLFFGIVIVALVFFVNDICLFFGWFFPGLVKTIYKRKSFVSEHHRPDDETISTTEIWVPILVPFYHTLEEDESKTKKPDHHDTPN
jgi:hypothetical protein